MSRKFITNLTDVELSSVHSVKILLCYLLDRLNREVTESQLLEISLDSEVVNYFFYAEAVDELIKNGSISKKTVAGESVLKLEEKGRMGSDYFNMYIPYYFRKRLLTSALSYFSKLKRESEVECDIIKTSNGFEVKCVLKDSTFNLLCMSIYAPDAEQAEIIKSKIMLNPTSLYEKIIGFTLSNEEEKFDDISRI